MKMLMENGKPYRKYTYEFVKKRAELEGGEEYQLLSTEYKTRKEKLLWKHNKCGHIFAMDADGFFNRKNRCPYCNGSHKLTTDEFKQKVFEASGLEYTVLEEYKGTHQAIKFKHNICNHEFLMRPNNFLIKGNRCPNCAKVKLKNSTFLACHSKSEEEINDWLKAHNLKFEREVKFKETGRLRFDFKVFKDKENFVLIEFDGRFHKKPSARASEKVKEKYEKQKINDERKNKFCNDNNIKLIRLNNSKTINKDLEKEFNDYPTEIEISQQE